MMKKVTEISKLRVILCNLCYVFMTFFVMPYILFILYLMSLFYLYSNSYIQNELTFGVIFGHLLVDIFAVLVLKWNYILWNKWCDGKVNRFLQIFSIFELVLYFIMIALNGFYDTLDIKFWQIKPITIAIELCVLLFYLGVEMIGIVKPENYLLGKLVRRCKDVWKGKNK